MFKDEIRYYISDIDPQFRDQMKEEGIFGIWVDEVDKWARREKQRIKERNLEVFMESRDMAEIKSNPVKAEQDLDIMDREASEIVRGELQDLISRRAFVLERIEDEEEEE